VIECYACGSKDFQQSSCPKFYFDVSTTAADSNQKVYLFATGTEQSSSRHRYVFGGSHSKGSSASGAQQGYRGEDTTRSAKSLSGLTSAQLSYAVSAIFSISVVSYSARFSKDVTAICFLHVERPKARVTSQRFAGFGLCCWKQAADWTCLRTMPLRSAFL